MSQVKGVRGHPFNLECTGDNPHASHDTHEQCGEADMQNANDQQPYNTVKLVSPNARKHCSDADAQNADNFQHVSEPACDSSS